MDWLDWVLLVVRVLVVFFALLPFIPFFVWHDQQLSLRIASGSYALYALQVFPRRLLSLRRAGSPRSAYRNLILAPILILSALANVPLGSMALYALVLITALYFSAQQFRHFVIPPAKV